MARWDMDLSPGSLTSPSSRGVGLTVCFMALEWVPGAYRLEPSAPSSFVRSRKRLEMCRPKKSPDMASPGVGRSGASVVTTVSVFHFAQSSRALSKLRPSSSPPASMWPR